MYHREDATSGGAGKSEMNTISKSKNGKNSRIVVTVERESAKGALLVKDAEGRLAWVQGRSYKDGEVNAQLFEKHVQARTDWADNKKAAEESAKAFRDDFHEVVVSWESEKAIGLDGWFAYTSDPDTGKVGRIFVPKSVMRDGKVPGWILIAKVKDKLQEFQGGKNHFKLCCEGIGGVELGYLTSTPKEGW